MNNLPQRIQRILSVYLFKKKVAVVFFVLAKPKQKKPHISLLRRCLTVLCGLIWLGISASHLQAQAAVTSAIDIVPTSSRSLPAQAENQARVARVDYSSRTELEWLASQLDIWENHPSEGWLLALLTPQDFTHLAAAGYRVTVDAERTAQLYAPRPALPDQVSGIPGYACYRTVEETYTSLQNLAANYPNLAEWIDIGDSWEKATPGGLPGYDLYVLKLTNRSIPGPKPIFFLMATIHAREYVTAELATRFAEDLLAKYDHDADTSWLLDYFELHILAQANPDGRKIAETGNSWRKNTDSDDGCNNAWYWGVDLNRNHSFEWGGAGASADACNLIYRGPAAGSEPEVRAIEQYVAAILPDQRGPNLNDAAPSDASGVFISLHSYGGMVLWPWGNTDTPSPNASGLKTLGRKFAYFNQYTAGQSTILYPTSGTSDDWAYGQLGVAAYTFELGTYFFESCAAFEQDIFPDNLAALRYAFKAARRPYQNPAGPETLDLSLTPGENHQMVLQATATDRRSYGDPSQAIAAAHYSLDRLPWQPNTDFYPLLPGDGSFNTSEETVTATLEAACLTPGRHTLYFESQDADGNWGVPTAAFLPVGEFHTPRWQPAGQTGYAQPGTTITYTLQAANNGNVSDTFTVTLTSQWAAALIPPVNTLNLAACTSTELMVTVTLPITATPGSRDTLLLTLTSWAEPGQPANASITSRVPGGPEDYMIFLPWVGQ
jgi:hypothetical protein